MAPHPVWRTARAALAIAPVVSSILRRLSSSLRLLYSAIWWWDDPAVWVRRVRGIAWCYAVRPFVPPTPVGLDHSSFYPKKTSRTQCASSRLGGSHTCFPETLHNRVCPTEIAAEPMTSARRVSSNNTLLYRKAQPPRPGPLDGEARRTLEYGSTKCHNLGEISFTPNNLRPLPKKAPDSRPSHDLAPFTRPCPPRTYA